MEELKQQWSVKLKIVQPQIMCAGRERVTCHYRGKAYWHTGPGVVVPVIRVEFKAKGEIQSVTFHGDQCITPSWEDLKIISKKEIDPE